MIKKLLITILMVSTFFLIYHLTKKQPDTKSSFIQFSICGNWIDGIILEEF